MGRVRVTSRIKEWARAEARSIDIGLLDFATVVHRDAGNLAPVDTAALVKSGRVKKVSQGHYQIIFGGGAVRYAKRRHYENRKNPQTLGYLRRAGDANVRNIKRYIEGR